jgi:hypothetical protein
MALLYGFSVVAIRAVRRVRGFAGASLEASP